MMMMEALIRSRGEGKYASLRRKERTDKSLEKSPDYRKMNRGS